MSLIRLTSFHNLIHARIGSRCVIHSPSLKRHNLSQLEDKLLEMSCDQGLQARFNEMCLSTFCLFSSGEYPQLPGVSQAQNGLRKYGLYYCYRHRAYEEHAPRSTGQSYTSKKMYFFPEFFRCWVDVGLYKTRLTLHYTLQWTGVPNHEPRPSLLLLM